MTNQPLGRGGEGEEPKGSSPSSLHRPDIIVAGIVLAVCVLLFARTFWFDLVPASLAQNVQPPDFPRLVLISVAIIALLIPFEYQRKLRRGIDLDSDRSEPIPMAVYITAIALVVFVGITPFLGTFASLLLIAAGLPLMWGERRWKYLVPYVVIFPTVVMWLFSVVLQVNFLPGIVGHVFR